MECCLSPESVAFPICYMKSFQVSGLLIVAAFSVVAQPSKSSFVASLSPVDRMTIVRNSIELTEWHEKSFWAQYDTYLTRMQEVTSHTYVSMDKLAEVDRDTDSAELVKRACGVLDLRRDELALTKLYFMEIGREHNGVIALQFLQTEAQLDMMESLNIYEHTYLKGFRLNPGFASSTKMLNVKYNTICKSIGLTAEEARVFYPVYKRYQAESDDIVGSDYGVYELFAGEATDYPSGLAKRLGYDLLMLMERELDLKKKYYDEMLIAAGPLLAARFLAWEDYYSTICKMTVWVESN